MTSSAWRVLALAAAVAGCAPVERAAGEAAPVEQVRLYPLDCGRFASENLASLDREGSFEGHAETLVVTCWLVRHPEGDFLWDTGLPDEFNATEGGIAMPGYTWIVPVTLRSQLAAIGLAPEEIEYVSVSHSHLDHVGNLGQFAASTFLVHPAEHTFMFRDQARASATSFPHYAAIEQARTVRFEGRHDVFGDGSVTIIPAPGHTPGHSVLLVKLANVGAILLSGDLYHLSESRERRTVPTFNTDVDQTRRSMDEFERIAAEEGARVIIQHESEHFAALPHAPDFLD